MEFSRDYDEINEYNENLKTLSIKEYKKKQDLITFKIKTLPHSCQHLNNIISEISRIEIKDTRLNVNLNLMKKRVKDQLNVINERFLPKQNELPKILNSICENEKQKSQNLGCDEF